MATNNGEVTGIVESMEEITGDVNPARGVISTGDMLKEVYDTNDDGVVNAADEATTLTGLEATVEELNYSSGVTGNIQEQLNSKADDDSIPTELADLNEDSSHRTVTDSEKSTWNAKSDFSGSYNDLTDKPTIPDDLADLNADNTHRTVTDAEKNTWNNKSNFSGSYNDLTNKPTIPDAQIQSDWEQSDNTKVDFIKNKPSNIVSDADYVHTDNNYTNADKTAVGNIPSTVTDLSDVAVSGIQNGQILKWNSTSQKFENANESGGGGSVNNAYKNIKVGETTIAASGEDTLELVAGSNVTLTPDASNKKVTITATGGGGGGGDMYKSVYDTNDDGKVNSADSADTATTLTGLTATVSELNYISGVTSSVQTQLNGKADSTDIPTDLADLSDDSTHRVVTDTQISNWNGKSDFSGSYTDLTDKPTIPDDLADLNDDATHRLVTDTEKSTWNGKSDFSGSYTDLTNKPTLGSASALDVASSGDASTTQVVKGDDSRLSDARTPISHTHTTSDITDFPTMSDYIQKSNISGLVKNDGTIDTNTYATTSQIPDITGKADKVSGATNGNFAALDSNGNLEDGGWSSDKTTTSASGNPISISGLKSNQLAVNPIITFEPIQAGSGIPSPSNVRAISGYNKIEVLSANGSDPTAQGYIKTTDLSESLGQTVYGGTLDLRSGKMTVTWGKSIVTWGDGSSPSNLGNYTRKSFYSLPCALDDSSRSMQICDKAPMVTDYASDSNHFYTSSNGTTIIFMPNSTDASTTIEVCYPIATPSTIQLTPHEISLLKDYAYVSTNGTTITLDYHNGELASLADVAQLGETVNNLLNNQTAIISESQDISYLAEEHYLKIGNIINLSCQATGTFTNGSYTNIGTIVYKPINNMWFPLINAVSGALAGTVLLTSEGLIRALPSVNGLTKAMINLMFIANQ